MQHQYDSSNEIKLSVIATVKNEVDTITSFVESLLNQSLKPDEVIIVDGNSNDGANEILKNFEAEKKIRLLVRDCNIAEGRNFAIESANNDYIAVTDAGCVVDKNGLKEIAKQRLNFSRGNARVGIGTQGYLINFQYHGLILLFFLLSIICPWMLVISSCPLFLYIKNNLWSQAKKASRKSAHPHSFWRVLLVMEFVRLIGIAGFIRGRLDRLLNNKFIERQFVWMGVKTLDYLDEKNRA